MRVHFGLISCLLLAGCGTSDYGAASYAIVVHDKYNHLKCTELQAQIKVREANITRLEGLSAKAGGSSGGSFLAGQAYGPELTDTHGNLRVLRNTYAAKNCDAELKTSR